MIDPAQSFSNALGQGLGIFKSYRDEARQDEDRVFNRQLALNAEDRADRTMKITEEQAARATDEFNFQKERRPTILKQDAQGLELTGEQIKGAKIENEWKPKKYAADINQSNASAAASRASAGHSAALTRRVNIETNAFVSDRRDRDAASNFYRVLTTGDFSGAKNLAGTTFDPLKIAAAVTGAPKVLNALQNPTNTSWVNDPATRRTMIQYANGGGSNLFAQRFGFKPGTTGIVDFQASPQKGKIRAVVSGVDAKTGKVRNGAYDYPAELLFDRGNIMARTFAKIGNDPRARGAIVGAVKAAHPELYEALAKNTGKVTDFEIRQRENEIKQIMENPLADPKEKARIPTLRQEIRQLMTGEQMAVESALFSRLGSIGSEVQTPYMTRAYDRIREKYPQASDQQVLGFIQTQIDKNRGKNPNVVLRDIARM